MALTFPLSIANLADLITGYMASSAWNLMRFEETSMLGSGEFLTAELAPPLWEAVISLVELDDDHARQIYARLSALDGSLNTFMLYDQAWAYPQADQDGAVLGASAVTIASINANRKAVALTGLPAGYTLMVGDMVEIAYGGPSRTALVQMLEPATASGGGVTPQFEIRPHLRPGIAAGASCKLAKPSAKMKLLPGSLKREAVGGRKVRISLTARQTLAAG